MNRRTLITRVGLAIVVVGVLIAATLYLLEYLSWKNVSLNLSPDTQSVIIYHDNGDKDHDSDLVEAARLSASGTVRLKTGAYTAVPSGEKVASTQINFTVANDMSVDITPYYSDEYLAKMFSGEIAGINALLSAKYPFVAKNYTVESGRFYHTGDWYVTTLYNSSPEPGDGVDIYAAIFHKTGSTWSIVNTPSLVFTYANFSSVPKDIVDSANRQLYDL